MNKYSEEIERMIVLKSIDIFKELSIEELYQVLKIVKYRKSIKDEYIIKKGEVSDKFHIVLHGSVGIYENDKDMYTSVIGTGGIFGELSIVDKIQETATTKALEDTLLLEFDNNEFVGLLSRYGTLAFAVAKTLSGRLIDALKG
jgi:CRP-like cAMP-binding protein